MRGGDLRRLELERFGGVAGFAAIAAGRGADFALRFFIEGLRFGLLIRCTPFLREGFRRRVLPFFFPRGFVTDSAKAGTGFFA